MEICIDVGWGIFDTLLRHWLPADRIGNRVKLRMGYNRDFSTHIVVSVVEAHKPQISLPS